MNDERVILDPELTALIIVDMENDFCKPGGKLYHPEGIDEVIPKQKLLLEKCRGSGVKVIFVQSVRYEDSPEFARFGHPPFIIKNTWGSALIEELRPEEDEPVIEKNTHDCFYRTGMDDLFTRLKIMPETHSVIVIGVASNICVYHAVIGFHVRHYHVIVPTDCCAGWPSGLKILETQMSDNAYNYNVKLTRSEKISFVKG
jgi:nicotinamidase-related amidase